jgi:hypothetical protein
MGTSRIAQVWPPKYPHLTWPWPPLDNRMTGHLMRIVPVIGS